MEIPGYAIEKEIGKGGMARVYLALHKALDRKVAIKVLNRVDGADSEFSDRFLREARIVASLSHPNIVTIYDVGEHDGHNYLVMELLHSGETLADKIKAGVDSEYALSIVRQVATALKVAHEKNIVHRDIKPDNIMFRADGSVVLTDFGVARSVDEAATQVTQAGTIIGTPQYISPEQAQGKTLGPYSDIYSLGIVFYEMLAGRAPYTADTPIALVFKHVSEPVPKLTGKIAAYQPLLDRMMAKELKNRYSYCDQMIEDIDRIKAGKPVVRATQVLSAADVDKARAAADNLTIMEDFPSIETGKPEVQKTEVIQTGGAGKAGTAEYQKTEILSTAAGAGARAAAYQATEILRPEELAQANATADKPAVAASKAAEKGDQRKLTLVEKQDAESGNNAKAAGAKTKLFLGITLGLALTGGVYSFVDIDIGKLKTMVGLDPGVVYARVGKLVEVPGGSFRMGNGSGDATEAPVHTVRVNDFKIGETEITQKQWRLVMGDAPSYFKACDDCPVDSVSWNDVQKFLNKLNEQTGLSFRLPTEAEWEYACRSGGKAEKYCGGGDEGRLAWYGENSGAQSHAVGQKRANGLGLHDMSGNVWEWTQDCWNASYDGAPANGQAWTNGACSQRVLRGGSWIGVAGSLSSTGRMGSNAVTGSRNYGFRIAQDI